ncbi:MAG: site-2 protease family protein [Haloarculaceae archaeon]
MVRALTWVLVGLVAYTVVILALRAQGRLPDYVRITGPITTVRTGRGRDLIDRLASPRRVWRAWGNLGVGVALVVMGLSLVLVAIAGVDAIVNPTPTPLNEPRNVLAIPGVNEFLPLSVAPEILFGLALGLIVHEGGHGLFCRVEGISLKSLGLVFLTVLPVGAFAEPEEEELLDADRGAQIRMYAAGVTNNFAVAIVALLLLFGPVIGSVAVVDGVPVGGVVPGLPADRAGVGSGDVITAVDGQSVESTADLRAALAAAEDPTVTVDRNDGDTVTVQRSVVVTSAAAGGPISVDDTVTSVNGTAVHTDAAFRSAVANRTVATLGIEGGGSVTIPIGAYTVPTADGAFAAAGVTPGERFVITSIDGERVGSSNDLLAALDRRSPDETITVAGYDSDGRRRSYEVTLGADDAGDAHLGVAVQPGITGVVTDDFGIEPYPAGRFLELLGGSAPGDNGVPPLSFAGRLFLLLLLPFAGAAAGFGYNFAGFTGIATNFFTVSGPLAPLGDGVFLLANVLFWTGWINLVIGQFNCIPAFPLDGGHIFRVCTESVVSRLPVPGKRRIVVAAATTMTVFVLGALLAMLFLPRLLT